MQKGRWSGGPEEKEWEWEETNGRKCRECSSEDEGWLVGLRSCWECVSVYVWRARPGNIGGGQGGGDIVLRQILVLCVDAQGQSSLRTSDDNGDYPYPSVGMRLILKFADHHFRHV